MIRFSFECEGHIHYPQSISYQGGTIWKKYGTTYTMKQRRS